MCGERVIEEDSFGGAEITVGGGVGVDGQRGGCWLGVQVASLSFWL